MFFLDIVHSIQVLLPLLSDFDGILHCINGWHQKMFRVINPESITKWIESIYCIDLHSFHFLLDQFFLRIDKKELVDILNCSIVYVSRSSSAKRWNMTLSFERVRRILNTFLYLVLFLAEKSILLFWDWFGLGVSFVWIDDCVYRSHLRQTVVSNFPVFLKYWCCFRS